MRTFLLLLVPLSLVSALVAAPPQVPHADKLDAIGPRMQKFVDDSDLSGAVCVVGRKDGIVHESVVGLRDIDTKAPIATFDVVDRAANVAAFDRMIRLAGDKSRVLPGHDMLIFSKFPTKGRIAKIK